MILMDEVLKYEGLVRKIISKYNFRNDYDDLYQAGMVGLVSALKKYDASRESSFLDYAYFWIKGEVLKTINNNYQVKLGSDSYKLYTEINKTKEELSQRLGREASNYEIGYVLGVSEEKIVSISNAFNYSYSLDASNFDENSNFYNKIAMIEKGYDSGIIDLNEALMGLEKSERALITSRYFEDMTQQETAKEMGISQVQVSRKESKILTKLRSKVM